MYTYTYSQSYSFRGIAPDPACGLCHEVLDDFKEQPEKTHFAAWKRRWLRFHGLSGFQIKTTPGCWPLVDHLISLAVYGVNLGVDSGRPHQSSGTRGPDVCCWEIEGA